MAPGAGFEPARPIRGTGFLELRSPGQPLSPLGHPGTFSKITNSKSLYLRIALTRTLIFSLNYGCKEFIVILFLRIRLLVL